MPLMMQSALLPRNPHWLFGIAVTALSAVLFNFGTNLSPIWPLAWLAPFPVLYYGFRAKGGTAFLSALLAYAGGKWFAVGYVAYMSNGNVPAGISGWVLVGVIPGIAFGLCVLLARFVARRVGSLVSVLTLAAAWSVFEFAVSGNRFVGALFATVNSQTDFLPVLQLVSITGAWGVSFLILLLPAALAISVHERFKQINMISFGILTAVVLFGVARLSLSPDTDTTRIGLVGSVTTQAPVAMQSSEEVRGIVAGYAVAVRDLAADGAEVIVLPEKIVGVTENDRTDLHSVLGNLARSTQTALVVGMQYEPAPRQNIAAVYGPSGSLAAEYLKHHLVVGIENEVVPGSELGDLTSLRSGWAVAICKDMDFPAWLRRYGEGNTRMLFAPALDFDVDALLHSRTAVVRSVENGFALARAANRGYLTLSDGYGRIIVEGDAKSAPMVTVIGDVPHGPGKTFYARWGDWFAWVCLVFVVGALGVSLVRGRSPEESTSNI